jgi:hypothetical protein
VCLSCTTRSSSLVTVLTNPRAVLTRAVPIKSHNTFFSKAQIVFTLFMCKQGPTPASAVFTFSQVLCGEHLAFLGEAGVQ